MKKTILSLPVFIVLIITAGCASILYGVSIRTEGNVSSVLAGGSLALRSSGRAIVWAVSSTSDGSGPVANGTFINQNGLLTVDPNERSTVLYIFATSQQDPYSDIMQIRVVTVTGVNITPVNYVVLGRTAQLSAQVTGTNNPDNAVTWRVSSNSSGTGYVVQGTGINSNGLLTVSPHETARTLYVTATSRIDVTKSRTISVSIAVPTVTSISITPANPSVRAGESVQLNAAVLGNYEPPNDVTWTVSSNTTGTGAVTPGTNINARGLLTVSNNETLPTLYVFATSVYDPAKTSRISVSVTIPVINHVIVSPANPTVAAGNSFQFAASVSGTNNPNTAVTWKVSTNAAGTGHVTTGTSINNSGLLSVSSNETAQTLFVFAISVFNPSMSGSVIVTIIPPAAPPTPTPPPANPAPTPPPANPTPTPPPTSEIIITPSSAAVRTNSDVQFSANVPVTWRVSPNANGTGEMAPRTTISGTGRLTVAPNEWATTLYVFAISISDPSKFSMVIVTITNNNENQGPNQGR